jgi:hypothetical protein
MTRRIAIPFVVAAMFMGSAGSLCAQGLVPGRDSIEERFQTYGMKIRLFEPIVMKRLEEIRPKGKDAADRSRKFAQEVAVLKANKAYEEALLTAEVAEVAIKEYTDGEYKQDLETVEGELALAKADVARAGAVFDEAKRRGGEIPLLIQLLLKKAQFTLEQAETKKEVLVKFTKDKRTREREAESEKAKSLALARKADATLERDKLAQIVREIANPPTPTETERKAFAEFDQALTLWMKMLDERAAFKGDLNAKVVAFDSRFNLLGKLLQSAEQTWERVEAERLRVQDAEVEMRIRDVLGVKRAG